MQPLKYPWNEMRVGEVRRVGDSWSRSSVQVSLHRFRSQCRHLGYDDECMPRFSCSYDLEHGIVTIERLSDGPLRRVWTPSQASKAVAERDAEVDRYMELSGRVNHWIATNNYRRRQGHGTLSFPPDLYAELRDVAPALAAEVAGIEALAAKPGANQHRLRRASDRVLTVPMSDTTRKRLERQALPHAEPLDDVFARRLASACKSSQSG